MALTRDQTIQAITDHRLSPRHVEGVGWIVDRGQTRVRSAAGATPELAVEAAVAEITALDLAAQERLARRIIAAQQQGTHFHRPRREQRTVGGEVVTVTVFDVLQSADSVVVVTGASSVVEAWRLLRELLAAPPGNGSAVGTGNGNGTATR